MDEYHSSTGPQQMDLTDLMVCNGTDLAKLHEPAVSIKKNYDTSTQFRPHYSFGNESV